MSMTKGSQGGKQENCYLLGCETGILIILHHRLKDSNINSSHHQITSGYFVKSKAEKVSRL
jgi:hypothetical protein